MIIHLLNLYADTNIDFLKVLDPNFRKSYGNVDRWFTTCINQPNFKKVLGDVVLCEKMAQFDNKRFAELHPKDNKKAGEEFVYRVLSNATFQTQYLVFWKYIF